MLHSVFLCSVEKLTSPKERKEERKVSTLNTGNAIRKMPITQSHRSDTGSPEGAYIVW